MEPIHKHIIIDLIPAYLANDVSDETRRFIEHYADKDQEIADLINNSKALPVLDQATIAPADALEFETINRIKKTFRKKMIIVAMITAFILLLPLTAMNFTEEVNWDLLDFVVMGVMLLGTGFIFIILTNLSPKRSTKIAIGAVVIIGFLLLWAQLAVGLI